jgi:tRNA (adenine-N(1)-)-methyltransferase non-catalytic subunit
LQDLEGVPFGWTWEIGPPKAAAPAVNEEGAGEVKDEDTSMDVGDDAAGLAAAAAVATRSGAAKQQKGGKGGGGGGGRGKKGGPGSDLSTAPGALRIMVGTTLSELEETDATNEDIFDDPTVAPRLTMVDVQALRDSGLEGQELIDELTKASSSFEKRTVWSQDKFIKKKEAKHLKLFTPLPPSVAVMAEYHFERSPEKVRGLRVDSLAQMLSFAGVAPGGRYLVVDGTSGLLTAACLDRMGGHGRLLAIHDNDSVPEFDIVRSINFAPHVVDDVLRTLHWAQADREYQHPYIPPMPERVEDAVKDSGAEGLKAFRARERERHRMGKKYAAKAELDELREELFEGDFDG